MLISKIKKLFKFNYFIESNSRKFFYFLIKLKRILILSSKTNKDIFDEYYYKNSWGCKESFSGPGSTKSSTTFVRKVIEEILIKYNIKSLSDIPCGDFNWMKSVDFHTASYTGYDIVSDIINSNNKDFSNEIIKFFELNIILNVPRKCDLIFCRDGLVHFSNKDVVKTLQNFKKSNSKYLLTTTFPFEKKNKWIKTGMWRSINLTKPPFNFPKPIELYPESNSRTKDKSAKFLGLWKLNNININ